MTLHFTGNLKIYLMVDKPQLQMGCTRITQGALKDSIPDREVTGMGEGGQK